MTTINSVLKVCQGKASALFLGVDSPLYQLRFTSLSVTASIIIDHLTTVISCFM